MLTSRRRFWNYGIMESRNFCGSMLKVSTAPRQQTMVGAVTGWIYRTYGFTKSRNFCGLMLKVSAVPRQQTTDDGHS